MAQDGGYRARKGSELIKIYISHSNKNKKGKSELIFILIIQSNENKLHVVFTSLDGLNKLKYRCRARVSIQNAKLNEISLQKIPNGKGYLLKCTKNKKLKVFYLREGDGYHAKRLTSWQTNGNDIEVDYLPDTKVVNEYGYEHVGNWLRMKETTSWTGLLEKFVHVDLDKLKFQTKDE